MKRIMCFAVLAVVAAYLGYTPALAGQIRAIEQDGPNSPRAAAFAARANVFTVILAVLIVAIVVLMVFKPT